MYAGPVMEYDSAIGLRHCETVLPNRDCPYLPWGCKGCTFRLPIHINMRSVYIEPEERCNQNLNEK